MTVLHEDIRDTSGGLGGVTSAGVMGRVTPSEPVNSRVRLVITQWPDDAPRGAVSTFCAERDISRKTFYTIRKRAIEEGPAGALEPKSRRPKSSPSMLTDEVKRQAIGVRVALEQSGLDHGPISVHDKMRTLRMDPVPSTASVARIFRRAGVARPERRRSRALRIAGSSTRRRTRAGSWTRPSMSSPAAANA